MVLAVGSHKTTNFSELTAIIEIKGLDEICGSGWLLELYVSIRLAGFRRCFGSLSPGNQTQLHRLESFGSLSAPQVAEEYGDEDAKYISRFSSSLLFR